MKVKIKGGHNKMDEGVKISKTKFDEKANYHIILLLYNLKYAKLTHWLRNFVSSCDARTV